MQEAYKRILERRRSQLVEQLRWTKELSSGLEKYGLVTREELRDIEVLYHSADFFFHFFLCGLNVCHWHTNKL